MSGLGIEKGELEARLVDLQTKAAPEISVDKIVRAVVERVRSFEDVYRDGTPQEKKDAVRTFVAGIKVHPQEARGVVQLLKMPGGPEGGNSTFSTIAGARYPVKKTFFQGSSQPVRVVPRGACLRSRAVAGARLPVKKIIFRRSSPPCSRWPAWGAPAWRRNSGAVPISRWFCRWQVFDWVGSGPLTMPGPETPIRRLPYPSDHP